MHCQIDNVFVPAVGDRDSDDLRQNSSALFPPEYYVNFLQQASVMKKIGAQAQYSECPDPPYELFTHTGDVSHGNQSSCYIDAMKDARTLLPQLGALANSGLHMLIWVSICSLHQGSN